MLLLLLLLHLKHVDLAGVLQRLPSVAEPHAHHLAVVVELLGDLRDLLASGQRILLKVGVEHLYGLRREAGASLALLGRLSTHKLHEVLLTLLIPQLSLGQPALQDRLQLLGTLGGDVQFLKPDGGEEIRYLFYIFDIYFTFNLFSINA